MVTLTPRQTLFLMAAIAGLLTGSAFVLEHGFGVIPCQMCWWQRYAHWAVAGIASLGLLLPCKKHPLIPSYSLILLALLAASLTGLAIAAWQFAAQQHWLPFPATCTSEGAQLLSATADLLSAMNQTKIVPCDKETFTVLGLSLAAWNIPAMALLVSFSLYGVNKGIK